MMMIICARFCSESETEGVVDLEELRKQVGPDKVERLTRLILLGYPATGRVV